MTYYSIPNHFSRTFFPVRLAGSNKQLLGSSRLCRLDKRKRSQSVSSTACSRDQQNEVVCVLRVSEGGCARRIRYHNAMANEGAEQAASTVTMQG